MNKRSAMTIAAGLVAALLTGAVALSMGLTGAETADAGGAPDPRIRTVHRTVTVHREAKAGEPKTVTIVTAGASSPVSSEEIEDEGFEDEDGFEDEHGEEPEEEHEDEEHDD